MKKESQADKQIGRQTEEKPRQTDRDRDGKWSKIFTAQSAFAISNSVYKAEQKRFTFPFSLAYKLPRYIFVLRQVLAVGNNRQASGPPNMGFESFAGAPKGDSRIVRK